MRRIWSLLVVAGCQRGETGAPTRAEPTTTTSAYAKDIEALCESMTRSGADQLAPEARQVTIAGWLSTTLQTPESRKFLVRIQPLVGDAKAEALSGEAKRVGLADCALAALWRTPG